MVEYLSWKNGQRKRYSKMEHEFEVMTIHLTQWNTHNNALNEPKSVISFILSLSVALVSRNGRLWSTRMFECSFLQWHKWNLEKSLDASPQVSGRGYRYIGHWLTSPVHSDNEFHQILFQWSDATIAQNISLLFAHLNENWIVCLNFSSKSGNKKLKLATS